LFAYRGFGDGKHMAVANDPKAPSSRVEGRRVFFASEFKALNGVVHNIQEFCRAKNVTSFMTRNLMDFADGSIAFSPHVTP